MGIGTRAHGAEAVLQQLQAYGQADLDRLGGKSFGYAYDAGPEVAALVSQAYQRYLGTNGLDPTLFPSLLRFENELVAMVGSHLGAGPESGGSFTSGGTESILLAVKAARDHARAHRHLAGTPEMILAETTHAAFHKAAHLLGVAVRLVSVDPESLRIDVAEIRRALSERTILLVGSAPSYAHGVVDPIPELGELALEHDLWLHVDACIGGMLLPYFAALGSEVPAFDLRVPGVRTLSVDLHKFGYTPKGASLLLYRDRSLRQHQLFACAGWSGYSVVNATLQGSKSGGPLAAAWAVLRFIGDEGYLELARQVRAATQQIVAGIEAIDGLEVLARPDMSLVSFATQDRSVFELADRLRARGWHTQPQLAFGVSPANIHLTITPANASSAGAFLDDLRDCLAACSATPTRLELPADLDLGTLDSATIASLLAAVGLDDAGLPAEMAPIHDVLNSLGRRERERLLLSYFNEVFRPATPSMSR